MRVELFNCPIDALTMEQTVSKIKTAIDTQKHLHHVVVNVAKLVHLQNDTQLRNSVVNCDIINADGQGVVWASKILGKSIPERVAGIDFMPNILTLAHQNQYTIFFFCAKKENVKKIVDKFSKKYLPKIKNVPEELKTNLLNLKIFIGTLLIFWKALSQRSKNNLWNTKNL